MPLDKLVARIRKSPVQKTLFHFTDTRNISSIRKIGLLSRRELHGRSLDHIPGGNELSRDLDDSRGLDAYVHLCFRKQHGMAHIATKQGRIIDLQWLSIEPDILTLPDVLIAPDNSVKTGIVARPATDALSELDLDILFDRNDWKDPTIRKRLIAAERYEILVPRMVAIDYVR